MVYNIWVVQSWITRIVGHPRVNLTWATSNLGSFHGFFHSTFTMVMPRPHLLLAQCVGHLLCTASNILGLSILSWLLLCAVLSRLVAQSCPTLCNHMDCSLPDSSVHGDSPGKNTRAGYHALLQGIFPTQGLQPAYLLHLLAQHKLNCQTSDPTGSHLSLLPQDLSMQRQTPAGTAIHRCMLNPEALQN